MIKIGRHINDITLNPLEWLLKPNSKKVRKFRNKKTAKNFLKRLRYKKEDMEFMTFKEVK